MDLWANRGLLNLLMFVLFCFSMCFVLFWVFFKVVKIYIKEYLVLVYPPLNSGQISLGILKVSGIITSG